MDPDIRPWTLNRRQGNHIMLPYTCNLGYNALLGEGSGKCVLCVILTSMLFMAVWR